MPWRLQPFLRERVKRARRLLQDSEEHRGSRELAEFVEACDLNERLHATFLDEQGRRRQGVSLGEKQEVRPRRRPAGAATLRPQSCRCTLLGPYPLKLGPYPCLCAGPGNLCAADLSSVAGMFAGGFVCPGSPEGGECFLFSSASCRKDLARGCLLTAKVHRYYGPRPRRPSRWSL